MEQNKKKVDLVLPVYNEAGVVQQIYERIAAVTNGLPQQFTFYYVDDGSEDATVKELLALAKNDDRIRILEFSCNFGHQAALSAGMDAAQGDVVITMDGDGQHPPELIPQILDLIEQGYDIVQMQRIEENQLGFFKRWTSRLFYRLINVIGGTQITEGVADFRALSRNALDGLRSMREYHRFLRGMISWMGYSSVTLPFHEPPRVAGKTKYSLIKMLRLASDAIFSFSLVPLYIGLSFGALLLCIAAVEMVYALSFWMAGNTSIVEPGWGSLMFVILTVSGMLMVMLGFIGVYVGYIFQEVKRRPVYIIKRKYPDDGK
jgi:dolichol-phosphate mannosyltransferase